MRRAGLLAVALLFLVAFPVQETGCTQTSQLALTRALASGTPRIDRWQATTCDKAWFRGHYYSVKAPGLAASALPVFLALRSLSLLPASDTTTIWVLGLFTVVPAFLLLVYGTARAAEWAQPGSGVLVAVALGVGTLALPFGTLWFGHVPGAMLGFAAFALLLRARGRHSEPRVELCAGLLMGCGMLFEYPLAFVAVALAAYAACTGGVSRAARFVAGAAPPLAVLFGYNAWAFGSPAHFSYEDAVKVTGNSGHDVLGANAGGFFGITWPSPHALAELLVSPRGMLTIMPVCLLGAFGSYALRRRAPLEAVLVGAVVAVFVLYNAGYTANVGGPFGGDSPGPRFLIAVLPFLVFPLGRAARSAAGATASLLTASALAMVLATATVPMVGEGEAHRWLDALKGGDFTHTVVTLLGGGSGWAAIVPFVGVAAVVTSVGVRRSFAARTGSLPAFAFEALCALVSWLLVAFASPRLFATGRQHVGLVALALATAPAAAAVLAARSRGRRELDAAARAPRPER